MTMPPNPRIAQHLDREISCPWLTDQEVVRRVKAGETALFEILMRRHNQRLFRAAVAILRDEAEAEDVMQEAYVLAFSNLPQFRGEAQFSTWLTRIAVHEAVARKRKGRRWTGLDNVAELDRRRQVFASSPRDPEESAGNEELRAALQQALATLPETQRLVFVLRDVEGLDTRQTAAIVGRSAVGVRVTLHRARDRMRQEINRRLDACASFLHPFRLSRCDRVVEGALRRILDLGGTEDDH